MPTDRSLDRSLRQHSALPIAVLFDMDGTLVDTEFLWFRTEDRVCADLGGKWSADDHARYVGRPLAQVAEHVIRVCGCDESIDDVQSRILDEMDRLLRTESPQWRPGARELLQEVRRLGLPTALVSAAWERLIRAVQDSLAADIGRSAFDVIVAGDHVTNGKPDPDPYLMAARLLNVDIVECLAIEDSPPGVQAAFAAGCPVVAVPHIVAVERDDVAVVTSLEGVSLARLWAAAKDAQP